MKPLIAGFLILAAWVGLFAGCETKPRGTKLAEVDGTAIYSSDLDNRFGRELSEQRERLYRLEKQKLDDFIGAHLLTKEAQRRGISVETLMDQQITAKLKPVSDGDVEAFYELNKSRLPVDLEKVRSQIRDHLQKQKIETEKLNFLKSLYTKAKISTFLKPPPIFRADLTTTGAPSRGSEKAPITVVKFEDFQCPYCKTVQPTFSTLLKRYDDKVRLVHKDLPLDAIHPQARPAAEAARCAGDQGKFWEYHDKLYAQAPKFAVEDLKSAAKEVGLNSGAFEQCFASGKFKAAVQRDYNEAASLGLTGTPAFFINGREISGAQPVEAFAAIIDEELGLIK